MKAWMDKNHTVNSLVAAQRQFAAAYNGWPKSILCTIFADRFVTNGSIVMGALFLPVTFDNMTQKLFF